jgi:hypothetical protein
MRPHGKKPRFGLLQTAEPKPHPQDPLRQLGQLLAWAQPPPAHVIRGKGVQVNNDFKILTAFKQPKTSFQELI